MSSRRFNGLGRPAMEHVRAEPPRDTPWPFGVVTRQDSTSGTNRPHA